VRGAARYLKAIVIALVIPAFVGAAAGGGEPLTKKELLKQGNAICRDADDQIGVLADNTFGPYNTDEEVPPEVVEAFGAGLVPILRGAIADIDALEPPTKDAQRVQKIINAFTETIDAVEADPSIFAGRADGEDPFEKPSKLARKYGLKRCA